MKACTEAQEAVHTSKTKYKIYAEKNFFFFLKRQLKEGEEVLLLLPGDKDK